jgi:hypothetical protein
MVMLPVMMMILMMSMLWIFSLNVGFCGKSSMKVSTALQALHFLKILGWLLPEADILVA